MVRRDSAASALEVRRITLTERQVVAAVPFRHRWAHLASMSQLLVTSVSVLSHQSRVAGWA
eukprot:1870634-Alexandrium_andersonii.AAC.1